MIPISLRISGFISYRDPVEIDFTSFTVAGISGANGAGKSTILDAITWALFGRARKSDDSLINNASDTAEVVFIFDLESNTYKAQRIKSRDKKTTGLELHIQKPDSDEWKPLTERRMRDTQAEIERIVSLDYETFINASFFLQGKADQFSRQTPAIRKQLLANVLGLEIWEKYRKQAILKQQKEKKAIYSLDGKLEEIDTELAEEDERITDLQRSRKELEAKEKLRISLSENLENIKRTSVVLKQQQELVEALRQQIIKLDQRIEKQNAEQDDLLNEIEDNLNVLKRSDSILKAQEKFKKTTGDLKRWRELAERNRSIERKRVEPQQEMMREETRLEEEGRTLKNKSEDVEKQRLALEDNAKRRESLERESKALIDNIKAKKTWEEDIKTNEKRVAELKALNDELHKQIDELKQRIESLEKSTEAICPVCNQPLSDDERLDLISQLGESSNEKRNIHQGNNSEIQTLGESIKSRCAEVLKLDNIEQKYREHSNRISVLENQRENIQDQIEEWDRVTSKRYKEVQEMLEGEKFASQARKWLEKIDSELNELGYDYQMHRRTEERFEKEKSIEEEVKKLDRAKFVVEALTKQLTSLEERSESDQKESTDLQEQYNQALETSKKIEIPPIDINQAEEELNKIQVEENQLRLQEGRASQRVSILDKQRLRKQKLTEERDETALMVSRYNQLERAFGKNGVPALLIERAIPQIEAKANLILGRLSSNTMSVSIVTQTVYKDTQRDDLRETLEIHISDDLGTRSYEMYSGGEAFRIDFAIRLALSEMLAKRAGARLQTLVIDEGFGSQDAEGRQKLIEAVNHVKDDFAKILVITHIEELKDAFETRIEVEKGDQGSTVRVY